MKIGHFKIAYYQIALPDALGKGNKVAYPSGHQKTIQKKKYL